MNTIITNTSNIITKPKHITSLATSGILVHVKVCSWSDTETDDEVTDEVTTNKKATKEALKVTKSLMVNVPEYEALARNRSSWYNWIKTLAYPWAGSWRYLCNDRIKTCFQQFEERKAQQEQLVTAFKIAYPIAVSNAAFNLGATFKASDYPDVEEVASKFSVKLYTANVPEGDFRNAVSNDLANDLHNHYIQQAEKFKNTIVTLQRNEFVEVMQAIAKSCDIQNVVQADGSTKVKRGKIYESTIERALEYCETFKQFNLDADARLEDARAQLQSILMGVSVDTLRESDGQRILVKEGIDSILSKFGMDQEVI